MTTPLATIADALIDFILSLLRDPALNAEFDADPEAVLASNGLSDVCVDDVRAVAPVIIDRPDVHPVPPPMPKPYPNPVVKEINDITTNVTIDNRSTIVDQSVNQNIWAGGDVTQIFDNEAIVASGDGAAAAGEDAAVDNSETDVETGDIAIGNETTDVVVEDSFNDESVETDNSVDVEAEESFNDESTDVAVDVEVDDSFNYEEDTSVETDMQVDFVIQEQL
ncbi:hypothetical protein BH10ACT5_BH10ACT5_11410 [soil metagenome]